MGIDRRKFMQISGLTVLTVAGAKASKALGSSESSHSMAGGTKKRWAMVIDLKKCHEQADCHDCVKACHLYHNVPDYGNRKDEIKWIWKENFHHAFHEQEHQFLEKEITEKPALVLCNHCDNPPCVRVCPTQATWKRKKDGVVMMDWHRCIGCRYCVVACPYGSRSFNWRDPRLQLEATDQTINPDFPTRTRGVVEKCTFCEERMHLEEEANKDNPDFVFKPECVKACKYGAMAFGDLEDPESEVRKMLADRFSIRRKPALGTEPEVYYLV